MSATPGHPCPAEHAVKNPSDAREWLAKLISFDTTTSKSNVPFVRFVAAYLEGALHTESGAEGARVLVEYGPQQDGVDYANLVVSIPASAAAAAQAQDADHYTGGYMLSGHSDCVPVDGQAWDTDPFTMTEKDGKLYGRGACDMKGFLAVMLSLVPEWAAAMKAGRFRKPLHLVFTYSEETDMEGCHQLLQEGTEAWRRVKACEGAIIGEPTMMELIIAHKGIHENSVTCRGTAAHSSLQNASFNAVEPATRVLTHLFAMRDRFTTEGPFDADFGVPYTTLCPGMVAGGQAINTTPDLCTLGYQFRNIPAHDADAIEAEVSAFVAKENESLQAKLRDMNEALQPGKGAVAPPQVTASVTLGKFFSSPHFEGNPEATVVKTLQKVVLAEEQGRSTVGTALQKVSFYTEAGKFHNKGLMTVVCGPGNIDQAHKPNEFIAVEQLEKCVRVVRNVVEQLCF